MPHRLGTIDTSVELATGGPLLSVVIPARNEGGTIERVLTDLRQTCRQAELGAEILVVDDHSTDDTAAIASRLGARVLSNPGRGGKGRALRYGFAHATGTYVIMMDADYSHRAEDVPKLLAKLLDGAGLVIGSRSYGGSDEYTHIRTLGNILLSALLNLLVGVRIRDCLNGFKGFRRELVSQYRYRASHFDIEIELIVNAVRAGFQIVEVPSHERARSGGEMKSRIIRHGTQFLWRILVASAHFHLERVFGRARRLKPVQEKLPV